MLQLSLTTHLTPDQVVAQAIRVFGPDGYGLQVKEKGPACIHFEGGGGKIDVETCAQAKEAEVTLISRDWDYQVRQFAQTIAAKP